MDPTLQKIDEWARRRGIFYPSCEIYGGLSGIYDYGPIGLKIKRGFENLWREYFLSISPMFFEIEPSNIMAEKVFIASGHLENFTDPIARCKKCGNVERADHLIEEEFGVDAEGMDEGEMKEHLGKLKCKKCGGELEAGVMNLMFGFPFGPSAKEKAYLRPETAQGPYLHFLRAYQVLRRKIPFGLAVVGKAFRNEISPRQLLIRQREFTQAELQIFIHPKMLEESDIWDEVKDEKLPLQFHDRRDREFEWITAEESGLPRMYAEYLVRIWRFYRDVLEFPEGAIRFRELHGSEKAFYNKYHWDIQYKFRSIGWKEIAGLHYRTDHDLSGHQKVSGKPHSVEIDGEKIVPHVLEVSFGVDRNVMALIDKGWNEGERLIISLPKPVSPYLAAVFPLVKRDGLDEIAREVFRNLHSRFPGKIFYDETGSIGRRYARQDEIGTYYGVTIDYQTKEDSTVTVRFRDTANQVRVRIEELEEFLEKGGKF